jgi:hypothetical protein
MADPPNVLLAKLLVAHELASTGKQSGLYFQRGSGVPNNL